MISPRTWSSVPPSPISFASSLTISPHWYNPANPPNLTRSSNFFRFAPDSGILAAICELGSQSWDFGLNSGIGTTIPEFWSQFQNWDHNPRILITIPELGPQ